MSGKRRGGLKPVEFEQITASDVLKSQEELKNPPTKIVEQLSDGTLRVASGIESYENINIENIEPKSETPDSTEIEIYKNEIETLKNELSEMQKKLDDAINESDDLLLKNSELELEIAKLRNNIKTTNVSQQINPNVTPNLGNHTYTKPGYQNVNKCGKTRPAQNGYQDWV